MGAVSPVAPGAYFVTRVSANEAVAGRWLTAYVLPALSTVSAMGRSRFVRGPLSIVNGALFPDPLVGYVVTLPRPISHGNGGHPTRLLTYSACAADAAGGPLFAPLLLPPGGNTARCPPPPQDASKSPSTPMKNTRGHARMMSRTSPAGSWYVH